MVDTLLFEQAQWIAAFQAVSSWLAGFAQTITYLGNEEFYLFVAPVIFWCFSTRVGLRIGIYLMLSGGINSALKILFVQPRPYWIDPQVVAFSIESSFGLPSGHAQHATVFWGALAASASQPAANILAVLLIFLIGASRVLLGVHFISDVLAGWLIGALLLYVFLSLEKPVVSWLKREVFTNQLLYLFGGSLLLGGIGVLARSFNIGWDMSAEWLTNAIAASPDGTAPDPMALSTLITNAGAFFGLASGAVWIERQGGFDPGGLAWKRLARFLLGVLGVAILWFGLGMVFPCGESFLPYVLRYIRYALVGLWVTGLAPWLFLRFNLANSTRTP